MHPKRAIITKVSDGLGFTANDLKYIERAFNKVVNIVDEFGELLLTDFYISEFKEELNDYIYHGFLLVSRHNIEYI